MKMKECRTCIAWVAITLALVEVVSSQKLLFRPNKLLQKRPDQNEQLQGFGFNGPRQYFTRPLKMTELDHKLPTLPVICPDKKTACPEMNTCCLIGFQQFGCCPLPMATCCPDNKHCCPTRTKCDMIRQACISGGEIIPWFEKTEGIQLPVPAEEISTGKLESVICPDGAHVCDDGQTCCTSSLGYSCCPLPYAVCCNDEVHCCPNGTTCDLPHGRCIRQQTGEAVNLLTKLPSQKIQLGVVQCDDKHECPTGNTCCKLPSDEWGCCPLPQAVCCDDHVYCCPGGTTCDVSQGKCNRGDLQEDWVTKTPAIQLGNVKCDATHECPSENTCCMLASGEWGCCPLPKAVCCDDHVHCCPSGTTCDVSQGKCNRGNLQVDWFTKTPAIQLGNVKCDATHECPSENTCCMLASGEWGCCPLPKAVCCDDHVHCCPGGTTCDVSQGKCNRGDLQVDWVTKTPAIQLGNVKCDSTHECPSENTCCMLASGEWGCCPLPKAVCCDDHVHCCPGGTTCDVSQGKCNRGDLQVDWVTKTPAIQLGNVKCDSTHECPSQNTCCMLASGEWGCCPLPKAVCCDDHVHCCPGGTTCDVSQGKCNRGNLQVDWVTKTPAIQLGNVKCDATHECPSENTCCMLASGDWGCCPLPKAVCCDDHVHCCPGGTTCDVSQGKCNRGNLQVDWVTKTPAVQLGNVKCDSTHECPSENTCCMLASGEWGCCPLPKAVCCDDHVHCCPGGTTCDVSQGKCNRGNLQTEWFTKTPAIQLVNVKCDATHECPSENTCCMLASGEWGCCPLPKAVCCDDHVHCCPGGTTCDVSQGKCNRGNLQLDWVTKTPAIQLGNVKCDSTHECPSENTCCMLASGEWGCCPLPKAVCCDDHVHCCPGGTTCDVSQGKCNHGDLQVDWVTKTPAIQLRNVKCDSTHECPSENTCCMLASGEWGCCPLPKAVCCDDHVHCCPSGTTCDVSQGKCNRGILQVDWFTKTPAIQFGNVKCDSTHECPSENTCCMLASGEWGCCPLPKAVCCDDHVHCCPGGTTCDVSQGKCNRGNLQVDWVTKTPAIQLGNVKCDSTHECPSENTCCMLASGEWGCCPLPKAVCCDDHVHCCPGGTTCDVSQGKCNRGDQQVDWVTKTPAIQLGNVKCDSTHECPSENTCCMLASGEWGCCPLPKAVCCDDHVHCCPSGTTCDVSQGKCNRGNLQVDWVTKMPAIQFGNVKCDATHECPSENTCCMLASGEWGCCPLPKAVCCDDHVHCCPGGTTCDVSQGKCNRGDLQVDWVTKTPAIQLSNVKCDSTHECPSENTCCMLASGEWGCCPLPKAVCCDDHVHCCPGGTTCDVSQGKCNRGNLQVDWVTKTPAIQLGNVKFDSTHECPSENTCCMLASGDWGCCPLPKAVCCDDHVHCCPGGTTCDVSQGKCNRGNLQVDWVTKTPAIQLGNVKCDSTHECPSENTCCMLASGEWGCCPLPKAVCCDDHVHCCPSGTTCDVSEGKCNRGNLQVDWVTKTPAIQLGNVKCDSTHECPSENTCCMLASGEWGCCPLPKAVCCDDHVHCCPGGTTCDVSQGKCNRGDLQVDWVTKTPAIQLGNVKCDATHECPSENTCCMLASGEWGCCPLPKAVCCDDHVHCCPSGTTCDVSQGKCNRGDQQVDWFEKTMAINNLQDVICPDGSECQDGQTCCSMNNGVNSYGCCPLPNAVCCDDGQHCCPRGYKCDLSAGTCVRGILKLPWFPTFKKETKNLNKLNLDNKNIENLAQIKDINEVLAEVSVDIKTSNVQCPDQKVCPDQYSCCSNGQGGYNCCPMPNGVCCDDHLHCCPKGYICDEEPGICRIPESSKAASNLIRKLGSLKAIPHS